MKFSPKVKREKDGGVEIRLSVKLTPDEIKSLDRIPDDPNVDASLSVLRGGGPSLGSKIDFYLCYLRIALHWVDIWNSRDTMGDYIMQSAQRRKVSEAGQAKKKRKRRR